MVEKIANCIQLVQMDCTSNFCEHNCTLLYKVMLPKHTAGAQTVLGSVVLLYVYASEQISSATPIVFRGPGS
jgi:hypothetical protein